MSDCITNRKRGRPKKDGSYGKPLVFLVGEDHGYMKKALEDELDESGGEVLRKALETLYYFKTNS